MIRQGEPAQELYEYLRDETDYPMDLIWKKYDPDHASP